MSEKTQKPNILLILADDQRYDTIGALGNAAIQTPHLDALVARGTTFTHAHIPGGTSGAVCMPSRAMLHSGRTLFHLDGEGQVIPRSHATLGETLRRNGHTTFGTGKWHNGTEAYARSFSCGDEIFFGGMEDHWNVPACHFDPTGHYNFRCPHVSSPAASNRVGYWNCDHIHPGRHSTELFTDTALAFVDAHEAGTPFFLSVSLMAPHDPRTMPERFREMYDPATIELPANFAPEHAIDTGALRIRDELLADFPREPGEIRRHIADYYAMISHIDDAFGRLVGGLEEKGALDNTIIVFAGDNGLAVGRHGLMGKQCLYDHSVRVPLVLAGPGIPQGETRDALVYLLDLFPTLCDLSETPIPESVEGRSLAPCIRGEAASVRDTLYLAYADTIRGVTNGRHKLIEYACGATQLFDLVTDPDETRNLADDASAAPVLARMRDDLRNCAVEWDDEAHPLGRRFWSAR